ncbi:MAG: hypothetical protein FJ276_27220, partial [Planctomycetes bacterium]|nr:hypothetical protein [Planctomycetota bacterium]
PHVYPRGSSGKSRLGPTLDSAEIRDSEVFDRDRDGALSRDEMPERLKRGFDAIDRDRNGRVSKDEMTAALEQYQRRQGGREEPRREEPRRNERLREQEKPAPTTGVSCADPVLLHDAERGKDLQVRVTWPDQAGPAPVIVFSHRVGGGRHDYRPLVEHWANGGYVVIQTDHSDSRELTPSAQGLDWIDRARDLSFLIDSLAEIEMKVPGVKGRMDPNRVGAGGHLIGAYAACVLAGQRNFSPSAPQGLQDDRVKAALLLSPQGRGQGLTEKSWEDVAGPLMVLSGSGIPSLRTDNPAEWRCEPFTFSPPGDKYLVWIEGLAGTYAGMIEAGKGDDEQVATWILDATLAFWDAHLKQDAGARARLRAWPVPDADKARLRIECKADADAPAPPAAPPAQGAGPFDMSFSSAFAPLAMTTAGLIPFEHYSNGGEVNRRRMLASGSKSFVGLAASAQTQQRASGGGRAERFDRMDRNRDGKVTPRELPQPQLFQRFDRNGDGVIQRSEIAGNAARNRLRSAGTGDLAMPAEPPHKKHLNLRYAEIAGVDRNLLSLDLYVPDDKQASAKRPVMIMIHGGGWRNGDKANPPIVGAKMRHFVGQGYIYATINYRLSAQTPQEDGIQHPVHAMDCAAAIAWIHDHIAEYGGDPDRLHLMGHSAGGHLAAIVGTNERFLKARGKDLSILKSNVLLDPAALDIPRCLKLANGRAMTGLYELAFGKDEANWRDASPQLHVAPGKQIPPTLVFYAGDRMHLDVLAPTFADALTKAGSPSRAVDTVTLDHGQINSHIGMIDEPMTALIMRLHAGEDASRFPAKLDGKSNAKTAPANPSATKPTDAHPDANSRNHNTAWIYKGTLKERP